MGQTRRLEVTPGKEVARFCPESQMRNRRLEIQSAAKLKRAGIPGAGGEAQMGKAATHSGERRDSGRFQELELRGRSEKQRRRRERHKISQKRAAPEGNSRVASRAANHWGFYIKRRRPKGRNTARKVYHECAPRTAREVARGDVATGVDRRTGDQGCKHRG